MAIHVGDQEFRLRLRKASTFLSSEHEIRRLPLIPRALRFIKNYHVIGRGKFVAESGIPKMMNVLNECFDLLGNITLTHALPIVSAATILISDKGFAQNSDE